MRFAGCLPPLLLAGCAVNPPPGAAPLPRPPPLPDGSYDWHVLLLAPFGSTLRELPFKLHEVLLFGDRRDGAAPDAAECYGIERAAPRFLARTPEEYLLCFRHDHLARIEATVNLPQAQATQLFTDACALWQKNAAAPTDACSGQEKGISYRGWLEADAGAGGQTFNIRLDGPEQP